MDNKGDEKHSVKYLYSASVQGIQNFIFQTNRLKDIVGASELVEQICTTAFGELLGRLSEGRDPNKLVKIANDDNWIVGAAGKIDYLFCNKQECEQIVRDFPRKVVEMAPGITLSQAVVEIRADGTPTVDSYSKDIEEALKELKNRLRAQRNKASRSASLGLIGIKRAPSTGMPGVKAEGGSLIDEASKKKRASAPTLPLSRKAFGDGIVERNIAYDIGQMAGRNNWIALIHADGNGVGRVVEQVGKNLEEMKKFSACLDSITTAASRHAYDEVKNLFDWDQNSEQTTDIIPIRPIVLGGDDLTMICRADIAIKYTQCYLEEFEKQSKAQLGALEVGAESKKILESGLTACAGIAFIKLSYPFHYAVDLAEKLCGEAKKKAKDINSDLAPSCLMFHKVRDSFVSDFSDIIERELQPSDKLSFVNGPYYCEAKDKRETIESLVSKVALLRDSKEGRAVKSHLRQWLQLLHENVPAANQMMKRLITMSGKDFAAADKLNLTDFKELSTSNVKIIPYYDMLSLASLYITTNK